MSNTKPMGYAPWVQTTMAALLMSATACSFAATPATQPAATKSATQPAPDVCVDLDTTLGIGPIKEIAATAPTVSPKVLAALKALHDVDATLDSFTASATKIDLSVRTGDAETRVGTVYYQKVKGVVSLAFHVTKLAADGTRAVAKDEDYVFTPPYFIHRDNTAKTFERKTIAPAGAPAAPLKLGTGVLPLPIGQDPVDMLKEFDITEVPLDPAVKLPAGTTADNVIVLKLVPRVAKTYDFKEVQLTIDLKQSLPVIIEQTKLDGNTSTFKLETIKVNKLPATLDPIFVSDPPSAPGWKITLDPKP